MTSCLVISCKREAVKGSLCAMHSFYFYVVLADPYFRDHPVPEIVMSGTDYGAALRLRI